MTRILRRTRKDTIKNGQVKTYLVYAFGEILLITIGILLALQLNSWNSERNDRHLEQQYLGRLLADLQGDVEEIDAVKESVNSKTKLATGILVILEDPFSESIPFALMRSDSVESIPGSELGRALQQITIPNNDFTPRRGTFNELIATGNIRVIQDEELRTRLSDYYAMIDDSLPRHLDASVLGVKELTALYKSVGINEFELHELEDASVVLAQIEKQASVLIRERRFGAGLSWVSIRSLEKVMDELIIRINAIS